MERRKRFVEDEALLLLLDEVAPEEVVVAVGTPLARRMLSQLLCQSSQFSSVRKCERGKMPDGGRRSGRQGISGMCSGG